MTKKYLSIMIERFFPAIWTQRYPRFRDFIYTFLQFLESKNKPYRQIVELMNFIDIDAIDALATGDPTDEALRENLLNNIYEQYLGSADARYLSSLLDDVLYIKNQKSINANKGTKNNFLFFFLIVLAGFFRILEASYSLKKHDGVYQYNGLIHYFSDTSSIDPFIYIVQSEFHPDRYEKILNTLNPAGMKALTFFIKLKYLADTLNNAHKIENASNPYVAIYNGTTLIGLVKPQTFGFYEPAPTTAFDIELTDNTKWIESTEQTGMASHYYIDTVFNTAMFGQGEFNNFKIVNNPLVSNTGYINIYYKGSDVVNVGTVLYDTQYVTEKITETYRLIDNVKLEIMIKYT